MINPFEYINELRDKWRWQAYFNINWHKIPVIGEKTNQWVMWIGISTGGLSDHEKLIEDMPKLFWDVCWQMSKVGGHYKFQINPIQWGYKLVNDFAREKGVSRQSIYNYPDKYEWLHVSKGVKFIKPKNEQVNQN